MNPSRVKKIDAVPPDLPQIFWQRDDVYHPEPVMPIWRSFFLESISTAFSNVLNEFSSLISGRPYRDINGWVYIGMIPYEGQDIQSRSKKNAEIALGHGETTYVRRWYDEWQYAQDEKNAEMQKLDLTGFSDSELAEHISLKVTPHLNDGIYLQGLYETCFLYSIGRLAGFCQNVLGWSGEKILNLLSGLSGGTTEPVRRLNELARIADGNSDLKEALNGHGNATIEKITALDAEFDRVYRSYLGDFGCRIFHHAVHYPTLVEKPEIILQQVKDLLKEGFNDTSISSERTKQRDAALTEARATLKTQPPEVGERFERILKSAQITYPIKEDCEYATFEVPIASLRYALLELGQRMTEYGNLETPEDIFFLELDEAVEGFRNSIDMRTRVADKKAEFDYAKSHPGPAYYGKPVSPQPIPIPEFEEFVQGIFWALGQYFGVAQVYERNIDAEIIGSAASLGQYTGPVCIVKDESEFDKLKSGDVLVCPITKPSWTLLFHKVGALITDVGGILSHPAIIAREYGIPAVVATRDATSKLRDGQIVTVDGDNGKVQLSGNF